MQENISTLNEAATEKDRREATENVKLYTYIGKTSKSAYERGREHESDRNNFRTRSHILKHIVDKHSEESVKDVTFQMRIVKQHRSALERKVHESVLIQNVRKKNVLLTSILKTRKGRKN